MTVSLAKTLDTCCLCANPCASPTSIEVDPICTSCARTILAETHFLPIPALHDLPANLTDDFTITLLMIDPRDRF